MIQLVIFCLLVLFGLFFGKLSERRHYKSILAREDELSSLPAIASRFPNLDEDYRQVLITGNVVIASDYFKRLFAGLLNIFGGAMLPYETLLDRARRESLLRLKEQAKAQGASYVFNVKFETSNIGGPAAVSVETLAYGTALIPVTLPAAAADVGSEH